MVELKNAQLDSLFQALADPTRRSIVDALSRKPASIGELAAPHDISFAAVSKHIGVLQSAGLVRRQRQGRQMICELDPARLTDGWSWLDGHLRFWNARLDALDEHLQGATEARQP